jgi:hypothetical protein
MSSAHYYCHILRKLELSEQILKNSQTLNFMKICPVRADLFHADGWVDRHDNVKSRFSQFCECA